MYTLLVAALRSGRLLAPCLLALSVPTLALEPETPQSGTSMPHAHQRALLEAYVECIRGSVFDARTRTAATPASACAAERSAYRATLPEERALQILEAIDAGPTASADR